MATFSYNGTAKHLFVAKTSGAVTDASPIGQIKAVKNTKDASFHFEYKSPGGVVRSDIIKAANILDAKVVPATDMQRGLSKQKVTLNNDVADALGGGRTFVHGDDYILNFVFYEYGSGSHDNQYVKFAAVRANSSMNNDASKFWKALLKSAEQNFSREDVPLLKFSLGASLDDLGLEVEGDVENYTFKLTVDGTTGVSETSGEVTITTKLEDTAWTEAEVNALNTALATANVDVRITGYSNVPAANVGTAKEPTVDGLIVEEVEAPYVLGIKSSDATKFKVLTKTVTVDAEEYNWGEVDTVLPTTFVNNGKTTADMEYFYHGERGDNYRNVGFPYHVPTTYVADPSLAYNFIEIAYFDAFEGVDVQKSNKHITLVVPGATKSVTNTIVSDINTAAGADILTALP